MTLRLMLEDKAELLKDSKKDLSLVTPLLSKIFSISTNKT